MKDELEFCFKTWHDYVVEKARKRSHWINQEYVNYGVEGGDTNVV